MYTNTNVDCFGKMHKLPILFLVCAKKQHFETNEIMNCT